MYSLPCYLFQGFTDHKSNDTSLYFCFFSLGKDVIGQAQSGTGKTATFSIAVLQQLDLNVKECQALVLAPTRELAQQVKIL